MQTGKIGRQRKGTKRSTFGGQEVKGQGHTKLKLDLKPWRRHHSRPHQVEYIFQFVLGIYTKDDNDDDDDDEEEEEEEEEEDDDHDDNDDDDISI